MSNFLIYIWLFIIIFNPMVFLGLDIELSLIFGLCTCFFMIFYLHGKVGAIKYKTFCITLLIYYCCNLIFYFLMEGLPVFLLFIVDFALALFVFFEFTKVDFIASDKYDEDYVYLIFFKPKSFYQFISSLFGLGVASMGSIFKGEDGKPKVARLKHSKDNLQITGYKPDYINSNYLLVNTGVRCDTIKIDEVELAKQSAYSGKRLNTRTNCVESQKPILNQLGGIWVTSKMLDFLPAYYIYKRLKYMGRLKK